MLQHGSPERCCAKIRYVGFPTDALSESGILSWSKTTVKVTANGRMGGAISAEDLGHMPSQATKTKKPGDRPSAEPWVLLVQNDLWPDGMLSASLEEGGIRVAGPFNKVCEASEWLRSNTPLAAVLDVALWDGASFDLAHELRRRNVPFLFFTCWTDTEQIPCELREMTFLKKPTQTALVTRLVSQLARRQRDDAPR